MNKSERSTPSSESLRTFCIVAETGNVTKAGERLARTQSAISVQIRKLEEQLGVSLFDRRARGMRLTEEGRKLLPVAKNALGEFAKVSTLFDAPLTGSIRVGIPDDYNETILENALAAFNTLHADVEVFVQSGCTAGFPEAIRKKDLDIAVYSAGLDAADTAPWTGDRPFFSEPAVFVAASDFELSSGDPVPLAIFERNCWWRTVASDALDDAGRDWKVVYLSESFTSVKAAIRAGLAVGVLAKSAVESSMRVLGKRQGFPGLPESSLLLLRQRNSNSVLVDEMEAAITGAIRHVGV